MKRREDLTTPRQRRALGSTYDPDAFGNLSEAIARFIGTARFLVFQTGVIIVWMAWNKLAPTSWKWDGYPYQFLNVMLSLQAAYAAPLILLAQNRQEVRDREQARLDRSFNARTQSDTEFLARELASVRLALSDMATSTELREQIDELRELLDELRSERGAPSRPRRAG